MPEDRSISDVLQDILRNVQDMVRAEIRLARVEIREDVRRAVSSGAWLIAGAVGALSAWAFLLWSVAYGLATRMPMWAATLIVSAVMAIAAAILIRSGMQRATRIKVMPERTVASVKESLEWIKHPTK